MASGVARQVDSLDGDPTEIPAVAVLKGEGVGPRAVVKLGEQGVAEIIASRSVEAVAVEHPLDRVCAIEIVGMDVNPGIGKGRVARHMVLMSVTVDDGVNWQPDPTGCGDGDRWVDDHRLGGAGDQQRVPRRVRAVRLTGDDRAVRAKSLLNHRFQTYSDCLLRGFGGRVLSPGGIGDPLVSAG